MSDSYRSELQDIIDRSFIGEFGGRATAQMIQTSIYADLPEHLTDYLIGKGIKAEIGAYFRAKGDDGLPQRPKVNDEGVHAQLSLLDLDELTYLYRQYVNASDASRAQAEKVRLIAVAQYQVDLAAKVATA